jgi:hypothetical protein
MMMDRESADRISAMFGMSRTSVQRHEKHVAALMQEAAHVQADAKPLRGRVDSLLLKVEALADSAHAQRNGGALLMAARELRGLYELMGRVTGEIVPPQVTNFFVGLGVTGEDEARRIIESHKSLEAYGLDDAERDCIDGLKTVLAEHPERAGRIRAELFGRLDAVMEAAVEPSGNGSQVSGLRIELLDEDQHGG